MEKILFADDDHFLREYISSHISDEWKNSIDIVKTAAMAIEMIKKNFYDKAVIDINFEGEELDGFDILREAFLKGIKERIIFTSVSRPMDLFSSGATAAFRKPLSAKKITNFLITNDYELLKEGEVF